MIISGFSGIGKTYTEEYLDGRKIKVLDLDSSYFEGVNEYVKRIMIEHDKFDFIFISTHPEVLDALDKRNLEYTLVIPSLKAKDEYNKRWINRGSTPEFIDFMYQNFDTFIKGLIDRNCKKIVLGEGQYLIDVICSIER